MCMLAKNLQLVSRFGLKLGTAWGPTSHATATVDSQLSKQPRS
jgi:hypothetical protein